MAVVNINISNNNISGNNLCVHTKLSRLFKQTCSCHSHCCSDCFDISIDVLQKNSEVLKRQFTQTIPRNTE